MLDGLPKSIAKFMVFLAMLVPCLLIGQEPVASKPTLEGRWKLTLPQGEDSISFLLSFTRTDERWVGDYIGATARLKVEPTIKELTVAGEKLRFGLFIQGQEFINFDGKLAPDGKKLTGTISQLGGPLLLVDLPRTELRKIDDPFELALEILAENQPGANLFEAGLLVLSRASAKKLPPEQVRSIADQIIRASAAYGPRWETTTTINIVKALASQPEQTDIALSQIRRAERMLPDDAPVKQQLEVFELAANLLGRAGKTTDAQEYEARATRLLAKDYEDFLKSAPVIKSEPFAGRKAKSERVVVLEVLSTVDAPPCAALDFAASSLAASFQPTEVILLNYHAHAPTPNPLTAPDTLERIQLYAEKIRSLPSVLINGKLGPRGGGPLENAPLKYVELRQAVIEQLQTQNVAKITLAVIPEGRSYQAKATVIGEGLPEKCSLRFVLTQDRIRFAGKSGIRYHMHVVRDFPGGVAGVPITKPNQVVETTIKLNELKEKIDKYLTAYAAEEGEFAQGIPNFNYNGLRLTALLQDDATLEILQAVQIPLPQLK